MNLNFFEEKCQDTSDKKLFGIRDDKPGERARIDETNGAKWIAVIENTSLRKITFTAIDNCIDIKREDGNMAKRCDGFLHYNTTLIFIELKESDKKGADWVKDAEKQLRESISYFEATDEAESYKSKKACIANNERPKFRESQIARMNQFYMDTGYVLRIEGRIIID
jgi:hypothetical protein